MVGKYPNPAFQSPFLVMRERGHSTPNGFLYYFIVTIAILLFLCLDCIFLATLYLFKRRSDERIFPFHYNGATDIAMLDDSVHVSAPPSGSGLASVGSSGAAQANASGNTVTRAVGRTKELIGHVRAIGQVSPTAPLLAKRSSRLWKVAMLVDSALGVMYLLFLIIMFGTNNQYYPQFREMDFMETPERGMPMIREALFH